MFGVKFTLNFLLFRLPKPIGFPNSPFQKRDSHFLNERFLKSQPRCMESSERWFKTETSLFFPTYFTQTSTLRVGDDKIDERRISSKMQVVKGASAPASLDVHFPLTVASSCHYWQEVYLDSGLLGISPNID